MSANTDHTDDEYSTFDPNLPTVQIPLGKGRAGVSVEGRFIAYHELPKEAQEAYDRFTETGNSIGATEVHMCDKCAERNDEFGDLGYLTTSDNIGSYRNTYTCSHNWREESSSMNGYTAGMWGAPRSWEVDIKIDGEDKRVITGDADPTYTLEIRERDRYHADAEVLGETTVTLPDEDGTVEGEVNDKPWEADVSHLGDGTVDVAWRRVTDDGETVTYAYEEGDRGPEREFVELNPDEEEYADRDGYDTKELATTASTYVHERECGSTDFTKVWPPSRVYNDENIVPIHDLDASQVPNAASHLGRIQNESEQSMSQSQFLRAVAEACAEFWAKHGSPEWVDFNSGE